MKRGDVIIIRERGTPAGKARPYVIVQRDGSLKSAAVVTGCPLTSRLGGAAGQRPLIAPSDENGLHRASEVEVDRIYTHPMSRIDGVVGRLDQGTMRSVDEALRRWLEL